MLKANVDVVLGIADELLSPRFGFSARIEGVELTALLAGAGST